MHCLHAHVQFPLWIKNPTLISGTSKFKLLKAEGLLSTVPFVWVSLFHDSYFLSSHSRPLQDKDNPFYYSVTNATGVFLEFVSGLHKVQKQLGYE